jgi:protocatechuate 3,4-dioxygenase beta subunit
MDLANVHCTLTPETDEGPYWVDERLKRVDVTEGQPGVPLELTITVYESDSGLRPREGTVADIWQANAIGLYSDQPDQPGADTRGQTFLRGCQITDPEGRAQFKTIYPGWYEGRTLHIHVRLRTFADDQTTFIFTTQIFFDEKLNDAVMATSPYSGHPGRDTTNLEDDIFLPELTADLHGDGQGGYQAEFRICVLGQGDRDRS